MIKCARCKKRIRKGLFSPAQQGKARPWCLKCTRISSIVKNKK